MTTITATISARGNEVQSRRACGELLGPAGEQVAHSVASQRQADVDALRLYLPEDVVVVLGHVARTVAHGFDEIEFGGMTLPPFDDFGNLPSGIYSYSVEELVARFGGGSEEREAEISELLHFIEAAKAAGVRRLHGER